ERNVMLVDFYEDNQTIAENVIFIGLLCKDGQWHAVVFEIGLGSTRELPIKDIQDISYSFEKTIKTHDITIDNYQQFLNPTDLHV
ncbi:DNA-binding transcriptional regulator, partial [Staphylococcus epidermidis]